MGYRGNGGCVRLVPASGHGADRATDGFALREEAATLLEKQNRWLNDASRLISRAGAEHIRPGAVVTAAPGSSRGGTPSRGPDARSLSLDGQKIEDFSKLLSRIQSMASSFNNARGHPPPDLIGIDAPTLLQVESELSGKEVADPLRFVDLIERGFNLRAKLVRQSSTVGLPRTSTQAHRSLRRRYRRATPSELCRVASRVTPTYLSAR